MAPELLPYRENANVLALRPAKDFCHKYPRPRRALLRSEGQRIYDLNATSRLLSLPLELRDRIYEEVLIEPTRWNKRHKPSCPDYPAADAFETPPFLCFDHPKTGRVIPQGEGTGSEGEAQHLCARRTGLGLLLVCRQVYEETAQVFFGRDVFCFRGAQTFVRAHHLLSHATRNKVRSVSIMTFMNPRVYGIISWSEELGWQNALLEIVASMDGLRAIELSRASAYWTDDLLKLRRLERITLLENQSHTMYLGDGERKTVYMTLAKPYATPPCPDEKHWGRPVCEDCRAFFERLDDDARQLFLVETPQGGCWGRVAAQKLLSKLPTCKSSEAPYRMKLDVFHFGKTSLRVWGLPRRTTRQAEREAEQQEKEAERQKRMELLTAGRLRIFQRPSVKYVTQEEEEARRTLEGPSPRHQRCRMQRAAEEQEQRAVQRTERREKAAKFEAVLRKRENKWQAKAKARSVRELQMQKKEAKKRVGKNA